MDLDRDGLGPLGRGFDAVVVVPRLKRQDYPRQRITDILLASLKEIQSYPYIDGLT